MMNLSINLTLGSPGAESVLNTAPAPEDAAVDSFSLKLADELNERELTPPIKVEDTRAVDPALLEAIAARQKLAADAEAATAKDARVWEDDPLAGLPVAENAAEVTESTTEDKPWFDIIEKAKSYGPALQANKTSGTTGTDGVVHAESAVLTDESNKLNLPASADAVEVALNAFAVDAATNEQTAAESADPAAVKAAADANAKPQAGQASPLTTAQTSLTTQEPTATSVTSGGLSAQNQATAESTAGKTPAATEEKAVNATSASAAVVERLVVPDSATTKNQSATKPELPHALQSDTLKTTDKTAVVQKAAKQAPDENALPVVSNDALTDSSAEQLGTAGQTQQATQTQQSAVPQPPAKGANPQSATAAPDSAAIPSPTEPELPAVAAALNQAMPVNSTVASATSAGADKTPAANAFAEHLKTVNQTSQQQQQAGAEQQSAQGQAKATADVVLANQPSQPVATASAFAQQLQQLQPTQLQAEHSVTATALTQPVTHSAGTAHATLMSNRVAEASTWQAPLALTEPAAAQQLKDRVMVQIQHKLQTAEVQLHPEDMGSMQIKLNLQQDQLSVQFVVQQGAAKEALEQQMPKLRELLEQQGIALTEGHVEQRQSGGQQEQRHGRSGSSGGTEADLATVQTVQMKVSDRMVDFYA